MTPCSQVGLWSPISLQGSLWYSMVNLLATPPRGSRALGIWGSRIPLCSQTQSWTRPWERGWPRCVWIWNLQSSPPASVAGQPARTATDLLIQNKSGEQNTRFCELIMVGQYTVLWFPEPLTLAAGEPKCEFCSGLYFPRLIHKIDLSADGSLSPLYRYHLSDSGEPILPIPAWGCI